MEDQEQKRVFGRVFASDGTQLATFDGNELPSMKPYIEHAPIKVQIIEEDIISSITIEK